MEGITRMYRHSRSNRRRRPGFSLLELMLVLAIIGALTAIAAWNLVGASERAKIRVTKTSLSNVGQILKGYLIENETYPPDVATLITAKYLDAQNNKDGFDRPFYYRPTGNSEKPFDLVSAGPDGAMGTADDIDYWTMQR